MDQQDNGRKLEICTQIVSAYLGNHSVPADQVTGLIGSVHRAISGLDGNGAAEPAEAQEPAVPIRKSIKNDYLICLESGKPFKSLKRHLMAAYGMTPDEYRTKWGLPPDYPMVAPAYAKRRSELAKDFGLGRKAAS